MRGEGKEGEETRERREFLPILDIGTMNIITQSAHPHTVYTEFKVD